MTDSGKPGTVRHLRWIWFLPIAVFALVSEASEK